MPAAGRPDIPGIAGGGAILLPTLFPIFAKIEACTGAPDVGGVMGTGGATVAGGVIGTGEGAAVAGTAGAA